MESATRGAASLPIQRQSSRTLRLAFCRSRNQHLLPPLAQTCHLGAVARRSLCRLPIFRQDAEAITHTARLDVSGDVIKVFCDEIAALETKLGCLLVQLPPSLAYDARIARRFFDNLKALAAVSIACEPRHPSWFAPDADELLRRSGIARVAADPARVPAAAEPGGSRHLSYFRLHGSPKVYYSAYPDEFINRLANRLQRETEEDRVVWCIFDNTTLGAATRNALDLSSALM